MKITSDLLINGKTRNQALSQFRFLRLQLQGDSDGSNIGISSVFAGKNRCPDNVADLAKIPPLMKNINRSLSRLDFLEQALAGASYQAALESAARMIEASPVELSGGERL